MPFDHLETVSARLVEPFIRPAQARVRKGVAIPDGSKGAAILRAIYEDCVIKKKEEERLPIMLYNVELDEEQEDFVHLASSLDCFLAYLDAGPGCGKSFVLAVSVIETILRNPKPLQVLVIVTAVTNTAVAVATKKIEDLKSDGTTKARILRIHSRNDDVTTKSDLAQIVIKEFKKDRTGERLDECLKRMKTIREKHLGALSMTPEELLEIEELDTKAANIKSRSLKRMLDRDVPHNIIAITVDSLLNAMNNKRSPLAEFIERYKNVVIFVDEASQLPESSLLALTETFPEARQRYCGDPRQLPPFCHLNERDFFVDFGAFSVAKLLERSSAVDRVTLRECRRMEKRIGAIASQLFYTPPLTFTNHSSVPFIPHIFGEKAPVLFVELEEGKDESSASGSRFNEEEVKTVDRLTNRMKNELHEYSLRVITFYKEQKERMKMKNPSLTVSERRPQCTAQSLLCRLARWTRLRVPRPKSSS